MIERVLQKDFWAKIAAVVLALLMWFRVFNDQNPLETRNVYVGLRLSSSPVKIVTDYSPDRVTVTLQGRTRTLDRINIDALFIPVDISSLETGSNQVPIVFASPVGGVAVMDVNPKSAVVVLDVEETKLVNVSVQTKGVPNEEYEPQAPVPEFATVNVTGPRTQVQKVVAVVGTIDITGAAGNLNNHQVSLSAKDAQNNDVPDVQVSPADIAVSVPMKSLPPARMIAVRPETRGAPKKGYRVKSVRAEPDSVKVRGETSVTGSLSAISTGIVDVSERSATFTYPVNLSMPQGVTPAVQRVSVTVEIEEDIVKATFPNVIVQFESLPVGYTWEISPTTVDITIEGRSDIIASIKDTDLQAIIDPSVVKGAGSYKLFVNVKGLPESIKFDNIVPSQVTLELATR